VAVTDEDLFAHRRGACENSESNGFPAAFRSAGILSAAVELGNENGCGFFDGANQMKTSGKTWNILRHD
jgi:hypothetical protein